MTHLGTLQDYGSGLIGYIMGLAALCFAQPAASLPVSSLLEEQHTGVERSLIHV